MRKTSFSRRPVVLVLAVAVGAVLPSGVAFAQRPSSSDVAQARALFNQGLRLREKGDALGAIEKLQAANVLGHTPITGLELGRTYEQTGKLVEARETLLAVARSPVQPTETARSAAARTECAHRAEKLQPRIPTLTVKVTGAPADVVTVTIDGAAVPPEALDAPRPANPGVHEVSARSTGGGTAELSVELKEGEVREADLNIPFVPSPIPASPTPAQTLPEVPTAATTDSGTSPLVYVGFGLVGAGVVVGSLTGGLAIAKASKVNAACSGLVCPRSVDSDLQSGRTLGNVSTASFVASGVGALVGVLALFLSHRHEKVTPKVEAFGTWIVPDGAGLQGTF